MRRLLRTLVALTTLAAMLSAGSAVAPAGDDARSEHQRIVDFWTPERVAQAVPRDFVFDPARGGFVPAAKPEGKPGGGNGGGGGGKDGDGGGGGTVTGAPWEQGGFALTGTGKVLFALGSTYYVCSASVVADTAADRSLVLTAAHCVYDNATGTTATNWMFIPSYDSAGAAPKSAVCEPLGCWTASALVLHDGFYSAGGFNGTAILHDFAFAVLGRGGDESTYVEDETAGEPTVAFSDVSKGTSVTAFGYPHADPYDGTDLTYCAGDANFDNRLFKLTYKLGCTMTGGSSGGPWYGPFDRNDGAASVAVSVNSYKYSGQDSMYGPKFDANTAAVYSAAVSTSAGGLVVVGG